MLLHGCLLFAFQRRSSKSRNASLKTFCLCSKFTITLVDVGIHNVLKGRLHTECTSHGRDFPRKKFTESMRTEKQNQGSACAAPKNCCRGNKAARIIQGALEVSEPQVTRAPHAQPQTEGATQTTQFGRHGRGAAVTSTASKTGATFANRRKPSPSSCIFVCIKKPFVLNSTLRRNQRFSPNGMERNNGTVFRQKAHSCQRAPLAPQPPLRSYSGNRTAAPSLVLKSREGHVE